MTTFSIKIDQIVNIFNINADFLWAQDTAIKYCEDSHKQTVMIISGGLNPGGGQGAGLGVVAGGCVSPLVWSGLVWSGDPADNLFTIWFPPVSSQH